MLCWLYVFYAQQNGKIDQIIALIKQNGVLICKVGLAKSFLGVDVKFICSPLFPAFTSLSQVSLNVLWRILVCVLLFLQQSALQLNSCFFLKIHQGLPQLELWTLQLLLVFFYMYVGICVLTLLLWYSSVIGTPFVPLGIISWCSSGMVRTSKAWWTKVSLHCLLISLVRILLSWSRLYQFVWSWGLARSSLCP